MDITTSSAVDTFMQQATQALMRTTGLGLGDLATATGGSGVATVLANAANAAGGILTATGIGTVAPHVATIAALKAVVVTAVPNGTVLNVDGYYAFGDGGEGQFTYNSASAAADNGGTVIQPTAGNGRWLRADSGPINFRQFGAKGDSTTDNSAAFSAAVTAAKAITGRGALYIPEGTYKLSSTATITTSPYEGVLRIFGSATGHSVLYCQADPGIAFDGVIGLELSHLCILGITTNVAVSMELVTRPTFRNVIFQDATTGVDIIDASVGNSGSMLFDKCTFINCGTGLDTGLGVNTTLVDGCYFFRNSILAGSSGVILNGSSNTVSNCTFETMARGVKSEGVTANANAIRDSYFEGLSDGAILTSNPLAVSGCYFNTTGSGPIVTKTGAGLLSWIENTAYGGTGSPAYGSNYRLFEDGSTLLNSGSVGIGTTGPLAELDVRSGAAGLLFANTDYNGTSAGSALLLGIRGASSGNTYEGIQALNAGGAGVDSLVFQQYGGNVGIGTTAPGGVLELNLGTAGEQRWSYNDANGSAATYANLKLSSTGVATFDAVGSAPGFAFTDPVTTPAGMGAATAKVGGTLKVDTTANGTTGGGEDTLTTYTLPAAVLGTDGDVIEFDVWGTCAANANTKDIKVYYGATVLIDGGVVVLNGVSWRAHGKIVRTGAATQTATCELTVGGTLLSAANGTICLTTAPAETLSGTVVFKCTGTSAIAPADNDIVQSGMHLKWSPNQ